MNWHALPAAGLLCGLVLFVVGAAFHILAPFAAPHLASEYRNEAIFRPWSGWTRAYMIAHPWLYGAIFASVYFAIRAMTGSNTLDGATAGLIYGLGVFVVGSLPVYALNFASFQVSPAVVSVWILQSLFQYTLAGLVLGWYCARTVD